VLKLSQTDFGDKLGVNRDVIKNIELDLLARPEQKEPLLRLVCKTFDVRYDWLVNGQGEMWEEPTASRVARFAESVGLGFYARQVVESYLRLDEKQREVIEALLKDFAENCGASDGSGGVEHGGGEWDDGVSEGDAIALAVADVRRRYADAKKG